MTDSKYPLIKPGNWSDGCIGVPVRLEAEEVREVNDEADEEESHQGDAVTPPRHPANQYGILL